MSEIIYMAWLPALAEFVLLLGDRLDYDFIETDGRYNTWRVMPKKEVSLKSHWEPFAGWQMEPEAMSEPVVIVL
ncbi:hypothetical protein KC887_09505, partial [Candidatus Kaiserbacteria bacterium]|nr:hypothetical protein [Candidatus Kaiserbacteria bacterium]